jgi:hypothetical protein
MRNLTPRSYTYILSGTVAAGTDGSFANLNEIDTRGYDGVRITFLIGTVTATGVITCRAKNSDTSGTYGAGTIDRVAQVTNSAAGAGSDLPIILDLSALQRRYVQISYQRTVANVVITGVLVELYNPVNAPVTQITNSANVVVAGPTPSAT